MDKKDNIIQNKNILFVKIINIFKHKIIIKSFNF